MKNLFDTYYIDIHLLAFSFSIMKAQNVLRHFNKNKFSMFLSPHNYPDKIVTHFELRYSSCHRTEKPTYG